MNQDRAGPMTTTQSLVRQEINRGMKAYKAGDTRLAWLHFQAALREDQANITALLWLAFLASNYDKRRFFLARVLAIDSDNKRAKDGLIWLEEQQAKKREQQADTADALAESATQRDEKQASSDTETASLAEITKLDEDLIQSLSPDQLKEQAKKGTIAQRARRRIGPLVILLICGAFANGLLSDAGTIKIAEAQTTLLF